MHTVTFNFPFVAACILIIIAVILVVATRRADWWRRTSMILLCCGFVVSGVSTLIGLKGADSAMMHGTTLGFTVSAVLVVVLRNFAPSNPWRGP